MTISHREFHRAANRSRPGFNGRLPKRKPSVPERHARKCLVCRHPGRAKIETAFLEWRSPKLIALQHNLAGVHTIYRHAYATGLYALRRFKLLCAAERIAEQFNGLGPDADAAIRAVEACSHLDARGESRGTRSRVVISPVLPDSSSEPAWPTRGANADSAETESAHPIALIEAPAGFIPEVLAGLEKSRND
jgi:hypothetical protein